MAALNELGGIEALGGPKTDNMYHAGWAWAGSTPFKGIKVAGRIFRRHAQSARDLRPGHIKPDKTPRPQFSHVNDIVPTIYDIVGIKPPKVVDGFEQDPIDGVSMTYTFADVTATGRKHTQYFDNNWVVAVSIATAGLLALSDLTFLGMRRDRASGSGTGTLSKDVWELYDLRTGLLPGR